MQRPGALLAVCFCAGLIAAFCSHLAIWLNGSWGFPLLAGEARPAAFFADWICPRLIVGGGWGLPYYLVIGTPRSRRHWIRKGLLISLLPSAWQLLFVYPEQTPYGLLGIDLDPMTPMLVIVYNLIWGFGIGVFVRSLWGRR